MRVQTVMRIAAAVLLLCGCGVSVGCQADPRLVSGQIAVVLNDDKRGVRLTAVDLDTMEVVRNRKLRSQSYSIDSDPGHRVVVTAQTGGVGPDADNAAAVWDLNGDALTYVTLPYPNPSSIAVADGRACIMHGFQMGDSLMMSGVGLSRGHRITTGTVSEWARDPEPVAGEIYLPVSDSPTEAGSAYSHSSGGIDALSPTLESSRVADIARGAMRVVDDPSDERNLILVGTVPGEGESRAGEWRITRIDRATGRIIEDRPLALTHGAMSLTAVAGDLAIADADGVDLDDPGSSVVILDGRTLAQKRRIEVTGTPAALAAWGTRLLVYDGIENQLLEFEPGASSPRRRVRLAGRGMGTGGIEVFDASGAKRE